MHIAAPPGVEARGPGHHHVAHHGLTRRSFLGGTAAGAAGVVVAAMYASPAFAKQQQSADPKPTTNVFSLNGTDFHLTFFAPGMDPSVITDFNGFVGVAQVQGTGTATNPDGSTETLLFDTDMRFMRGVYVGQDDKVHNATFGFV
jgi:hypothetical protein